MCTVCCLYIAYVNVTVLFSTAEPLVQVNGKPSCCFFKFSPKLMFTKVLKAQLWVYLRPLQQTSTVYLQILRLKPVTEQGSRHIRIRSLKIELNSRVGHWQSIDFKHVLQNWFKQPHTNWGIDINAFDESGNDLAVTSLRPGEEGLVRTLRPVPGVVVAVGGVGSIIAQIYGNLYSYFNSWTAAKIFLGKKLVNS